MTILNAPPPQVWERNWASLSHLTVLLTALVGFYTGGTGAVVALLVPLALYIYFSGRSRYVAYHALQATVFQAVGGVVYVVTMAVVGSVVAMAWVITGVLTLVLVGILLVPVALAISLFSGLISVGLPVILFLLPLRAAYLTYYGKDFEYPLVGRVVGRVLG